MLQDVTQLQAVRVGDEHRRQKRIGYAGVAKKHDYGSVAKLIRAFDFDANAKDAQATFSVVETHLKVRCEAPRWGVELNVNSLKSSSRDRKMVIPEL